MIPRARHRDVHQAALFLELVLVLHRPRRGKPPVDGPDENDCFPFLAFGAVRGAEDERRLVVAVRTVSEILCALRRLERERREERVTTRVAGGDVAQLIEVGEAWLRLVVALLENAVVQAANVPDLSGHVVVAATTVEIPKEVR